MLTNFFSGFFQNAATFQSLTPSGGTKDRYQFRRTLHAPRCPHFSARSCASPPLGAAAQPRDDRVDDRVLAAVEECLLRAGHHACLAEIEALDEPHPFRLDRAAVDCTVRVRANRAADPVTYFLCLF